MEVFRTVPAVPKKYYQHCLLGLLCIKLGHDRVRVVPGTAKAQISRWEGGCCVQGVSSWTCHAMLQTHWPSVSCMCYGQPYLRAFVLVVPSVPKALPPSICLLIPSSHLSSNITAAEASSARLSSRSPLPSITLLSHPPYVHLTLYTCLLECMLC